MRFSSMSYSLLYGTSIMMTGMPRRSPMFSYHFIMQSQMLLQHSTKSGSGMSRSPFGQEPVSAYAKLMRA